MTEKPKPEVQAVLDEFARKQQFKNWVSIRENQPIWTQFALEKLATLAFTRGFEASEKTHQDIQKALIKSADECYKKGREQGKLELAQEIWAEWYRFKSDYVEGSIVPYVKFEKWLKFQLSKKDEVD